MWGSCPQPSANGERSWAAPGTGLNPVGTARCGDRHDPLSANREGQPGRLPALVRSEMAPATVWGSGPRPSAIWSAQSGRRRSEFAKLCAPSGVWISNIRRSAICCCSSTVEPHVGIVQTSDRPRAAAPVSRIGKAGGSGKLTVNQCPSGERFDSEPMHQHAPGTWWSVYSPDKRVAEVRFLAGVPIGPVAYSQASADTGLLTRPQGERYLTGPPSSADRSLVRAPACRAGAGGFDPRSARHLSSGCSSAWPERRAWDAEAVRSIRITQTILPSPANPAPELLILAAPV